MNTGKHSLYHPIRNDQRTSNPKAILKDRLLLMLFLAAIYFLLNLLHIGCPLKFSTGISCPGCGMTRAYFSLLHLDFGRALYYHPLFMLVPFMVILYLFDSYINPKLLKVLWGLVITTFLVAYFFRLFISHSDVVEIDISSGIMIKLYQLIFGGR